MAPSTQQHIEMAVEQVEPELAHDSGERIERAAHVDRLGCDEHPDDGARRQHEEMTASSRRSEGLVERGLDPSRSVRGFMEHGMRIMVASD